MGHGGLNSAHVRNFLFFFIGAFPSYQKKEFDYCEYEKYCGCHKVAL